MATGEDLLALCRYLTRTILHLPPMLYMSGAGYLGRRLCTQCVVYRYNLDSHLPQPQLVDCHGLGEVEAIRQFLVEQVHQRDGKVFLVKEQAAAGEHAPAQ